MKINITLVVAVVLGVLGRAQAYPAYNPEESDEETTVWAIPQLNGTILWMTEEEAALEALKTEKPEITTDGDNSGKVRFFLYTQENPSESIEIHMNDIESLMNSPFDSRNPTRFMIHGWATDHNTLYEIREAVLLNGERRNFNYISVDWSVYSGTINYISAKNHCSTAGKNVAEFIDWLHDTTGLSFDTLAVYGHSLGAHVAGFTGKNVKRGRIHTIVGLDPAMPLFRFKLPEKRLAATDGEYVETIQTNGGFLGFYHPIGQAAFYPNGGRLQPGCGTDRRGSCSHGRSQAYFAEALSLEHKNGLTAVGCKDFESLKSGTCNQYAVRPRLGDPINARFAKGIFYLETNAESPYGIHIKY